VLGQILWGWVLKMNLSMPISIPVQQMTYFRNAQQRHFAIVTALRDRRVDVLPPQMHRRSILVKAKYSAVGPEGKITHNPIEGFTEGGTIHDDIAQESKRTELRPRSYVQSECAIPGKFGRRFKSRDQLRDRHTRTRIAQLSGLDPDGLADLLRLDSGRSRCHDIPYRLCGYGKSRSIYALLPERFGKQPTTRSGVAFR
jgi:hypothetical protein